ncbi:hypothetical protein [Candidatus Parabeggiatoa sp. HSG14]|uniref:hypothetical protein n=1 Tax=Candidatus Parabeggiatoa sp. HSG14 TaxID=3055593 RepID=UPI0025A761B1|nr:hypothetical protein [Thiotrichales bacterium HSG14]
MFISGGLHPDHDTINKFRKRFLNQFIFIFTIVLEIAFKLGDISIDGTKIKANASKHKAMSWEYANKLEAMLQAEVKTLLKQAFVANNKSNKNSIDIPAEIERREKRLAKIGEIKEEIEKRAKSVIAFPDCVWYKSPPQFKANLYPQVPRLLESKPSGLAVRDGVQTFRFGRSEGLQKHKPEGLDSKNTWVLVGKD